MLGWVTDQSDLLTGAWVYEHFRPGLERVVQGTARSKNLGKSLHHWKNSSGLRKHFHSVSQNVTYIKLIISKWWSWKNIRPGVLLELDLGIKTLLWGGWEMQMHIFCQGYQRNVCSVSLMVMEGIVEVKKAGILPLIPFSGCAAPLIQADNPFSCFSVAWYIILQT